MAEILHLFLVSPTLYKISQRHLKLNIYIYKREAIFILAMSPAPKSLQLSLPIHFTHSDIPSNPHQMASAHLINYLPHCMYFLSKQLSNLCHPFHTYLCSKFRPCVYFVKALQQRPPALQLVTLSTVFSPSNDSSALTCQSSMSPSNETFYCILYEV